MFCLNELDLYGEPFWQDKKLYGPYGRDGLHLRISLVSCGSINRAFNKTGL